MPKSKKLNIIVLMGGPSAEHEVSLETGRVVFNSLDKNKYATKPVLIPRDGRWLPNTFKNKPDVVFIAMHGTYGEDGTIQGLLDAAGIPYTGSGVLASALAMDKVTSSQLLANHEINTPSFLSFSKNEWSQNGSSIGASIKKKIGLPCVIKPSNCGSSIGITIARKSSDLKNVITFALTHSSIVMAQQYISGIEVTCAVLDEGKGKNPLALPPTQIIPKDSRFFDYHAKYTAGATEEITPPRLPQVTIRKIQQTALQAHQIIGCSGMSRTDMIIASGKIYVLELNTIPGMTKTSLLPQAAAVAGISFSTLLDKIICAALNK